MNDDVSEARSSLVNVTSSEIQTIRGFFGSVSALASANVSASYRAKRLLTVSASIVAYTISISRK